MLCVYIIYVYVMYFIRNILELTYDPKKLTVTSIFLSYFSFSLFILEKEWFSHMKFVFCFSFLN